MKQANVLYHTTCTIRILLIAVSAFLIYNGIGVFSGDQHKALFMYANLTSFSVWVIFLMGAILLVPLGRLFCGICPVGEVNYRMSRLGLKKKPPLKLSFLQAVSLLFVFVGVIMFHISRHPHHTAMLMTAAFLASIVMGLIYQGNAFCMLLCPANAFLRFYGRISCLKLKAGDRCAITEPCMVFLNPCSAKREQCHLCFRCFKNSTDLHCGFSTPEREQILAPLTNAEFFIFTILSGLTFMAFIRVVRQIRELFVFPPYFLADTLKLPDGAIIPIVILFGVILYPLAAYFFSAAFVRLTRKEDLADILRKVTAVFILPLFSVHLILAIVKLNARMGFLPFSVRNPSGAYTVDLYAMQMMDIPADLISASSLRYLLLIVPAFFFFLNTAVIARQEGSRGIASILVSTVLFAIVELSVILWLFRGML